MPSIVYQTVAGHKYAYSSESYWDKEKKAPRSHRVYLGTVDEETGEIIPSKSKRKMQPQLNQEGQDRSEIEAELQKQLEASSAEIMQLKQQMEEVKAQCQRQSQILSSIASLLRQES